MKNYVTKKWRNLCERYADFNEQFEENKLSLFYALLALINNIAYGISMRMIYTTDQDLRYVYGTTDSMIGMLNTTFYAGYTIGSMCNLLHRWFNRQLLLIFFVLTLAIASGLLPFFNHIAIACVSNFIAGCGGGAWDAGSSIWLIEVWPSRIDALFQVNQFAYNLGGIISYFITVPIVWYDAKYDETGRPLSIADRRRAVAFSYSIYTYLQSIIPLIFLALYFVNRYQKRAQSRKPHSHNTNPFLRIPINTSRRRAKLALCFLWLGVYYLAENVYYSYVSDILEKLGMPTEHGNSATMIFLAASTVGPLITTLLCVVVRTDYIIFFHYIIIYAGFLLANYQRNCIWLLHVSNVLIGYGTSIMLPGILTFIEKNLQADEFDVAIYTFVQGVVWLVTPYIVNYGNTFCDNFMLIYVAVMMTLSLMLFFVIRWCLFRHSKRFKCYIRAIRNSIFGEHL